MAVARAGGGNAICQGSRGPLPCDSVVGIVSSYVACDLIDAIAGLKLKPRDHVHSSTSTGYIKIIATTCQGS